MQYASLTTQAIIKIDSISFKLQTLFRQQNNQHQQLEQSVLNSLPNEKVSAHSVIDLYIQLREIMYKQDIYILN